jgi:hypothetical protein
MNQINSGELRYKQSNVALEVKGRVALAMEEIISVGARVRPLKLNGKRVGWLRPLAYSERKVLDRLIEDDTERISITLQHCTTLTESEIDSLDIHEINSILNRLYRANLADLSLFPYISAFVTTQVSQNLWSARHDRLFDRDTIRMPDGSTLRFMALSDHVSLWATLSTIRIDSIQKLEQTLNFGTLIKAQIGKSADKYVSELIRSIGSFQVDLIDPWTEAVDYMKLQTGTPHFEDGFGHSHQDNTVGGLMREMKGMFEGDRHEQLMTTFYEKQLSEAQEKEEKIQQIIQRRRAALEQMEDDGAMVVLTDTEMRRREREMRNRSAATHFETQLTHELSNQGDDETQDGNARVAKYFAKEQ